MDNSTYTYAHRNQTVKNLSLFEERKLLDELVNSGREITYKDFVNSYCYELELILKKDDLASIAESIQSLEKILEEIKEEWEFDANLELPNLSKIYESLSPLILSSITMNFEDGQQDFEGFFKNSLESLRIVIEDDLIFWKSKL